MVSQRIVVKYPPRSMEQPLLCQITREFDLEFNILRADVAPGTGSLMVLEVSGEEDHLRAAMEKFESFGVSIQALSREVVWDEQRCTHCGACITLCPSGALSSDKATHMTAFDAQRCVACEYCIRVCPMDAMRISL